MTTVDTSELRALANRLETFRSKIVPIAAGVLTKQVKVLSQQQQRDFKGNAFKPLTPAYKKRKVKAGHPGVPNLTFSGKFMANVGFDKDTQSVTVPDEYQPQAKGLDKDRKIWGVHPDSDRLTNSALEDAFNNIVNANA